jgi:hypothetical protein
VVFILTYTLLKTLAYPPAEWLGALEPGFQWGAVKGGKVRIHALFSFALGTFVYFRTVFLRDPALLFLFRAGKRESAEKALSPFFENNSYYSFFSGRGDSADQRVSKSIFLV